MFHRQVSSEKIPRRSLILAGGGVRIAYQTGVLRALEEEGIEFQHVDGTSGGIFNTAMLASGHSVEKMMDRWRSLPISFFAAGRPFLEYLRPLRMWGFSDAKGIREKVFPYLGIDISSIRSGGFPAKLEEVAIDLFSSIYFAKLDLEIPFFAKEVSVKPHFGNTLVDVFSEMVLSGKVYLVHANWILIGPWYQVVGLDFKDVAIRVFLKEGNSEKPVIEGKLFQSFWNRVKASFFTSTKGKDGMRGGIDTRIKLLRKMIQI